MTSRSPLVNRLAVVIGAIVLTLRHRTDIKRQDIIEERIVTHMNTHNIRREEITARDLMTPQSQVEVLQMYDVARATVGDIIKTFRQMGRQHALVVEEIEGKQTIRGILSTTQIAKQTGIHVDTSQYAGSFAELQASIS